MKKDELRILQVGNVLKPANTGKRHQGSLHIDIQHFFPPMNMQKIYM